MNHNVHLPDAPDSPGHGPRAGSRHRRSSTSPSTAGSYEYICDLHPNMVGTLTVA